MTDDAWRIVVEESRDKDNFFDEAILAADAELTSLRAEVEQLHGSLAESNFARLKLSDRIKQLEEAVEWALNTWNLTEEEGNELIRRAGMEG